MKTFRNTYITRTSAYLPGEPIDNEAMDQYIGSINRMSARIKARILQENGISHRHYGIDAEGRCTTSVTEMGARVIAELIDEHHPIGFLSMATTGGDAVAPGLANFVQGHLHLPPIETLSIAGICAASMGALTSAAQHVQATGSAACAGASEFPSRLFRKQRFEGRKDVSFDAHFLRWMLSDGAGAVRLEPRPSQSGKSLKVTWIHSKSFSGDFATCMQVGLSDQGRGYLDYDHLGQAQDDGAFDLKQDIRLLTALFDVGIGEYVSLVDSGAIDPAQISALLCHYSSERFKHTIRDLMQKANLLIDETLWFSNLKTAGNTGSASIFIMLDEFCKTRLQDMTAGSQILLFVPESGRFTVSFALLEVVDAPVGAQAESTLESLIEQQEKQQQQLWDRAIQTAIGQPHQKVLEQTLRGLAMVWQQYRSQALRTSLARKVFDGHFTHADYLAWMSHWIPQVREGSVWMHRALAGMSGPWRKIAETVRAHIGEEQFDWQILFDDYQRSGGTRSLDSLSLTAGASALNAYMHTKAMGTNAWELLGGIYIIEGTGEKIIGLLLPKMMQQGVVNSRFLTYHGQNDTHHLDRWLWMLESVIREDPAYGPRIVQCARDVASLYLLHWEHAA